jgi:hypothetical protein
MLYQWTSPWQSDSDTFLPGTHQTGLDLRLSPEAYNRFKSAPVTLHVTLALSRLQSDTVMQIAAPSRSTIIPGVGICSPWYRGSSEGLSALACRMALRLPRRTYATTQWTSAPCTSTQPPPEVNVLGTMWIGDLDSGDLASRISSAINPVPSPYLYFNIGAHSGDGTSWHLCPGVPITFTQYHLVDRTQTDFTIPNFQVPTKLIETGY